MMSMKSVLGIFIQIFGFIYTTFVLEHRPLNYVHVAIKSSLNKLLLNSPKSVSFVKYLGLVRIEIL